MQQRGRDRQPPNLKTRKLIIVIIQFIYIALYTTIIRRLKVLYQKPKKKQTKSKNYVDLIPHKYQTLIVTSARFASHLPSPLTLPFAPKPLKSTKQDFKMACLTYRILEEINRNWFPVTSYRASQTKADSAVGLCVERERWGETRRWQRRAVKSIIYWPDSAAVCTS